MADLSRARVLVTGARGFIGSHLARSLIERGAEVHGSSRSAAPAESDGVRWWRCDLADAEAVGRLWGELRPDYAFHLSSMADGRRDRELVLPIFRSETVAALNVMLAAAETGTERLVIPGSLEEPEQGAPPSSPYAAAKAATRSYAELFHRSYGTPVVMTRIFMTYGPGQPAWKLIPATAASLLRGEAPAIASPDRPVDWIYVDDVVDGLVHALHAPDLGGRSVDLGSGELTPVREIVERLRALIAPDVRPRYGEAPPRQDEQVRRADLAETGRLLGWRPRVGLDEGLRRTVAALRDGG